MEGCSGEMSGGDGAVASCMLTWDQDMRRT